MDIIQKAKELLKAKKEAKEKEIIKTAEVPKPLSPIERAKALRQKCDSKYTNHIAKKSLTGLK